jgi:MFS family permease
VGRIGAVISPVAGGYALSAQWSQEQLFAAAGIPALICAGWIFLLGIAHRRAERAAHGETEHRPRTA